MNTKTIEQLGLKSLSSEELETIEGGGIGLLLICYAAGLACGLMIV